MTRPERPVPSWLAEHCPPWCVREHHEGDHVEDRYHQDEPGIYPVVGGTADTVPITSSLEAVELVVRRGRHVGESVTWVAVEAIDRTGPRLLLTLESARHLASHLVRRLGTVDG
ncbi:DUF6907 domain-containing protein [Nocardioides lianchengensis]|uniref:Uncharacterized protein n=1 Tax=Nocardioides lianchengensis TaxID=1045774 RepID=A0A1G6I2I6_9ACTN|nr:hypothetical protein [Nocardioides lianchengensis]NYG13195.1 hypothetical protein [Nocardioides lianchengensis]SDC00650.1 hypothetical protein SAMN05421872_10131 [Nocardioides lianchengensis]